MDFVVLIYRRENKGKQKDRQILGSWARAKNPVEHKSDDDNNCSWWPWNGPQRPGTEGTRDQRKNRDHADYSTVEISLNN